MRRWLLQLAAALILVVCLGSCVSEIFDQWDHTMQTGHDTESILVMLASLAGAVLVMARAVASAAPRISPLFRLRCFCNEADGVLLVIASGSSPPLSLRI
ncbi:MAG TPA: hypothetical protein VJ756_15575 [Terriglobales bacterium]|nr:hypothetical protein [Terriglobales bacterium]